MPRIKKQQEEMEEEMEEEEMEEELEEEEEEDELEEEEGIEIVPPIKKKKPKPKEIKRRFGIMAPQPLRIVDTETNEVIGEGEPAVIQALTDILERLERIEVKLGVLG